MTECNTAVTVRLSPALMLDCKLTWEKVAYFVAYANVVAVFLHMFGFGPSLSYSFIFCNCAAWATFVLLVPSNYLPKAATVTAMAMRVAVILFSGAALGAIAFALIMGIDPRSLIDRHLDILVRMVLLCIFCGSSMVFFYKSRERISEAKRMIMEEKIKNLDIQNMSIQMELKLLQAQIEPHFLFNTLSNIMNLIESDPDKAKAMMGHLSGFLRVSIHTARQTEVPIAREMEIVTNYLDIHKIRMGDRLRYQVNIPNSLLDCQIPPLLIQPLVENSIKHGLEPQIDGGEITIQGEMAGDTVRITVADSGRGIKENTKGNGIGLENVRKRIEMASRKGRLILEENVPSGIRATIEIAP